MRYPPDGLHGHLRRWAWAPPAALLGAPAPAWAAAAEGTPLFSLIFLGFVLLMAGLVGAFMWRLRADVARLLAGGPDAAGERLRLFRDTPAGMPEGTVRAAIALLVISVCLPGLLFSASLGLPGTGELGTILGGVLGFYFGTRSSGGEAEGFRRQAESSLAEARRQERAATEAQDAALAARTAAGEARQEAEIRIAAAQEALGGHAAEAEARLGELRGRVAQAASVARALAALLPAGPAATAAAGIGTAGAVLEEAARAAEAIGAAIERPASDTVGPALEAARAVLRRVGEGTELADRLGAALSTLQEASGAMEAVQAALARPDPERIEGALGAAAAALARGAGGGFAATLAPALGAIGTALRSPALATLAGGVTPVAVLGGLLLGAVQAWRIGTDHYRRWMARVLDRPVTPDLLPVSGFDGGAARALIRGVPVLEATFGPMLGRPEATQEDAAELVALCFRPDAAARFMALAGSGFASPIEAEVAVNALRRLVLETELDGMGRDPVPLPDGGSLDQPGFRRTLDALREAGAGDAIETVGLLAGALLRSPPGPAGLDVEALAREALSEAAKLPEAAEVRS